MGMADFRERHPQAEIIKMLETSGTDELGPYVSAALIGCWNDNQPRAPLSGCNRAVCGCRSAARAWRSGW